MTGGREARSAAGAGLSRLRTFLQRELGTRRVRVEAEGPEGEIAVLRVPEDLFAGVLEPRRRARVVELARREGFRYAALDAEPEAPAARGSEGRADGSPRVGGARRGGDGCASSPP